MRNNKRSVSRLESENFQPKANSSSNKNQFRLTACDFPTRSQNSLMFHKKKLSLGCFTNSKKRQSENWPIDEPFVSKLPKEGEKGRHSKTLSLGIKELEKDAVLISKEVLGRLLQNLQTTDQNERKLGQRKTTLLIPANSNETKVKNFQIKEQKFSQKRNSVEKVNHASQLILANLKKKAKKELTKERFYDLPADKSTAMDAKELRRGFLSLLQKDLLFEQVLNLLSEEDVDINDLLFAAFQKIQNSSKKSPDSEEASENEEYFEFESKLQMPTPSWRKNKSIGEELKLDFRCLGVKKNN